MTKFESKHGVYDRVWMMRNGGPEELMIYAVAFEMNHMKNGLDVKYYVTKGVIGAGVGNNKEFGVRSENIYATKEDCVMSLL